ncbi:MAG TPA: SDR family oxidoreductase [Steroidobacteraceae bacterium]|nr:SDR family oxidoreductase [Steroidobacteraceae bacterium]
MRLENKVAIVTGAAGNIGFAAARQLLAEGARVLLVDVNEPALGAAVERLGAEQSAWIPRVATCTADVASAAQAAHYAQHAEERLGRIDVFFDNAGIEGPNAPITEFPEDAFERVMQINVRGVFLGIKYVAPRMRDGGSIIITSSIAGLMGSGSFTAYTTSKHAVIGLMREAAIDLAPRRIRVNTIHPGFIKTEMLLRIARRMQPGAPDEVLLEQLGNRTLLGRCLTTEEVAQSVAFLASDDSRMVTGHTFVVDGGTLLK